MPCCLRPIVGTGPAPTRPFRSTQAIERGSRVKAANRIANQSLLTGLDSSRQSDPTPRTREDSAGCFKGRCPAPVPPTGSLPVQPDQRRNCLGILGRPDRRDVTRAFEEVAEFAEDRLELFQSPLGQRYAAPPRCQDPSSVPQAATAKRGSSVSPWLTQGRNHVATWATASRALGRHHGTRLLSRQYCHR